MHFRDWRFRDRMDDFVSGPIRPRILAPISSSIVGSGNEWASTLPECFHHDDGDVIQDRMALHMRHYVV